MARRVLQGAGEQTPSFCGCPERRKGTEGLVTTEDVGIFPEGGRRPWEASSSERAGPGA